MPEDDGAVAGRRDLLQSPGAAVPQDWPDIVRRQSPGGGNKSRLRILPAPTAADADVRGGGGPAGAGMTDIRLGLRGGFGGWAAATRDSLRAGLL